MVEDAVSWWAVCAHRAEQKVSVHEGGLGGAPVLESQITHVCANLCKWWNSWTSIQPLNQQTRILCPRHCHGHWGSKVNIFKLKNLMTNCLGRCEKHVSSPAAHEWGTAREEVTDQSVCKWCWGVGWHQNSSRTCFGLLHPYSLFCGVQIPAINY